MASASSDATPDSLMHLGSILDPPLTPALSPAGRGGKGADLQCFQVLSSTLSRRSQYLAHSTRSVPSPLWGEG